MLLLGLLPLRVFDFTITAISELPDAHLRAATSLTHLILFSPDLGCRHLFLRFYGRHRPTRHIDIFLELSHFADDTGDNFSRFRVLSFDFTRMLMMILAAASAILGGFIHGRDAFYQAERQFDWRLLI